MIKTKICKTCKKSFTLNLKPSDWLVRKFCSRECANMGMRGIQSWMKLDGLAYGRGWNKGKTGYMSKQGRKNIAESVKKTIANETPEKRAERIRKAINNRKTGFGENHKRGKEHHAWKETGLGYTNTHKWVNKVKPRTGICELCGLKRKTEYSNVDHKYRRVIKDYMELCKKCHKKWEIDHNL